MDDPRDHDHRREAEQVRALLEQRARVLARPLADSSRAPGTIDAIAFSLARERYAVDARYVFAVFALAQLVPLPGAQLPVVGLTRWRGDVLTVLDLRRSLGAATTALDDLARVVVLGDQRAELGVLADAMTDPIVLTPHDILALPAQRAERTESGVLRGITRDAVLVLDVPALLARQSELSASSLPQPT